MTDFTALVSEEAELAALVTEFHDDQTAILAKLEAAAAAIAAAAGDANTVSTLATSLGTDIAGLKTVHEAFVSAFGVTTPAADTTPTA